MKGFLNSRYVSLGCAGINTFFAVNALTTQSWGWFIVCGFFAGFCFNNYLKR